MVKHGPTIRKLIEIACAQRGICYKTAVSVFLLVFLDKSPLARSTPGINNLSRRAYCKNGAILD